MLVRSGAGYNCNTSNTPGNTSGPGGYVHDEYRGGGNGGNGGMTSFNGVVIAEGGQGGTSATQSSNGIDGVSGRVFNYNYPSNTSSVPDYIPQIYVFSFPRPTAGGGIRIQGCRYSGNIGDMPGDGRPGYCVISYQVSSALPIVLTNTIENITNTGALAGGIVWEDGGAEVTSRGVAYSNIQSPTISGAHLTSGMGSGSFSCSLTLLQPNSIYYVRAFATNFIGTAYGNEVSFITNSSLPTFTCGTSVVTDIDGNTYETIEIGSQCWMKSNLKVSKYRIGDVISSNLTNNQWSTSANGAFSFYNNQASNDALYGKLYNWNAVVDVRGLCPVGWHVPSDIEWTMLTYFLGGDGIAGGKMKNTTGWNSGNVGATNSSGFTALPGGSRDATGLYFNVGEGGHWWSSSAFGMESAWSRSVGLYGASLSRGNGTIRAGYSVRCVRG